MKILLPVPQILQNPELPNGCEITSLCEVLQYLGFPADKCMLADCYLPRSRFWYGTDPDAQYMGDPHRDDGSPETGYYCFAGPIVAAAEHYFRDLRAETRFRPVDRTGSGREELEALLLEGHPFIFWASLHFEDIQSDPLGGYLLPNGTYHKLFHQLHCMVCCGMDEDSFFIADPLDFNRQVEKSRFMKIYRQLGSRAVAILPADELGS